MRKIVASVFSLVVICIASAAFMPTVSAIDTDGDGIPDFEEAILGTNVSLWTNTDGIVYAEASVNPENINLGGTQHVTITVATNTTQGPSDNVTVTYIVPAGVEYQNSATIEPDNITFVNNTTILEWIIPDLMAVSPWNVTFKLKPLNTGNSGKVHLNMFPDSGVAYKTLEGGKTTGGGTAVINCVFQSPGNPGKNVNFGFVAHQKGTGFEASGNLQFHDHANDLKLHGDISTLEVYDQYHAKFTGIGTINGINGYSFTVEVWDWDEPGINRDEITISIPGYGGYTVPKTTLTGGNIQIHKMGRASYTHIPFPEVSGNITPGNQPPVASFTVTPTASQAVIFDAKESYDPDPNGYIKVYRWDFENDGIWDIEGDVIMVTHSYNVSGTYTVKLEVEDDHGATDYTTKDITVGAGEGISGNVTWNGKHSFEGLKNRWIIGQPRGIEATAYEIKNNLNATTYVTVELKVDGILLNSITEPLGSNETKDITVSGEWVPMRSGVHFVSLHVYDGEYWVGPTNAPTATMKVFIEKVK